MEIYSIGCGEIIYEILKSVALCVNGGHGVSQAIFTIGGMCGVFIVYFSILYGNAVQLLKTWAFPVLLSVNILFIPCTQVYVIDTITKSHYKIDKVPYGLAVFASHMSKFGYALTSIFEQNFSVPDDLKYQNAGFLFGADILEKSKEFVIVNQNLKENIRNFIGQCVKYDIMLNHKYSFDDLKNSKDIWTLISSKPSNVRGFFWIPINGGKAEFVSCKSSINKFGEIWKSEIDKTATSLSYYFLSNRSFGTNSNNIYTNDSTKSLIKKEFLSSLQSTISFLSGLSTASEEILRQQVLINTIKEVSYENSILSGNLASYATNKAIAQQNINFDVVGRLATRLLPVMKAVIEALVYSCFIFILPLCMLPNGYRYLLSWISVIVWLQAWAPMYAILNFVMNIAAKSATLSAIGYNGGITISNISNVSTVNSDIKAIAGYLTMSIPFICIAIVKGIGSFVHLATQLTGTSMQVASSGASEAFSGNFSYGNISLSNMNLQNLSQLQRSYSSNMSFGDSVNTGVHQMYQDAISSKRVDTILVDSGAKNNVSLGVNDSNAFMYGVNDTKTQGKNIQNSLSKEKSLSNSQTYTMSSLLSKISSQEISDRYGYSKDDSQTLHNAARLLFTNRASDDYTDSTNANIGLSIGGGVGFGGGINSSSQSSNSSHKNISKETSNVEELSNAERVVNSFAKHVAQSNRNDDITQIAKQHVKTIAEIERLQNMQSNYSNMSQTKQDAYNKTHNLDKRITANIRGLVKSQLEKEGYTTSQAVQILESDNEHDQQIVNDASNIVAEKLYGNYMRQPKLNHFKHNRLHFSNNEQRIDNDYNKQVDAFTRDMFNVDDEKAKLSVRGTHSNVRQLFEKRAEQIKGSINDRAKYGATKSVLINMKNNIVGDSDKVQED